MDFFQGHEQSISCDAERTDSYVHYQEQKERVWKHRGLKRNGRPPSIRPPSWTKLGGRAARTLTETEKQSRGIKFYFWDLG